MRIQLLKAGAAKLGALALFFLLAVAPATAQFSSPTRDVDNPARQPWTVKVNLSIPAGQSNDQATLVTVPAGKRLVIECYTVDFRLFNSQRLKSKLDVGTTEHFLQLSYLGAGSGVTYAETTNLVRFYVNPGQSSVLRISRGAEDMEGTVDGEFTFSGYFVNVP